MLQWAAVPALRETFGETYPATPESVARARGEVSDYAVALGATPEVADSIRLAVSEAMTNAVIHAYRGSPGDIHVTAAAIGGELWVLVADEGCGFQTPAERPGLGLGLALIAQACDEFVITERGEGGTEARMRFVLAASAPARRT